MPTIKEQIVFYKEWYKEIIDFPGISYYSYILCNHWVSNQPASTKFLPNPNREANYYATQHL